MTMKIIIWLFLSTLAILAVGNPESQSKLVDEVEANVNEFDPLRRRANTRQSRAPVPSLALPTSVPVRFPVPAGSCNICDTGKPVNLTLRYTLPAKTSVIQSSYASCINASYPNVTSLIAEGLPAIPVKVGTVFTLKDIVIGNRGVFSLSRWGSCHIDTSCYTPLIVGDQIGPFRVLAGNHCRRRGK